MDTTKELRKKYNLPADSMALETFYSRSDVCCSSKETVITDEYLLSLKDFALISGASKDAIINASCVSPDSGRTYLISVNMEHAQFDIFLQANWNYIYNINLKRNRINSKVAKEHRLRLGLPLEYRRLEDFKKEKAAIDNAKLSNAELGLVGRIENLEKVVARLCSSLSIDTSCF